MQLPLEGLAAAREDLHLPGDQRVEFLAFEAGEVAVFDKAAIAEAERPNERPIALDPDRIRKPVVHVPRSCASYAASSSSTCDTS